MKSRIAVDDVFVYGQKVTSHFHLPPDKWILGNRIKYMQECPKRFWADLFPLLFFVGHIYALYLNTEYVTSYR